MSAGEERPGDAIRTDIPAPRAEATLRRLENLGDSGLCRIASRDQADQQAWLPDARETRTHGLAPDHVALWTRADAVERSLDQLVLGGIGRLIGGDKSLAFAGAADVGDDRGPALRFHLITGRIELLRIQPSDDAAIRLPLAEPERIVRIAPEVQMMRVEPRIDQGPFFRLWVVDRKLPGRLIQRCHLG